MNFTCALIISTHLLRFSDFTISLLSWDYRYYDRQYTEEHLALDDALVKEYFPVSFVVPAVLEIYQKLLGVRFEPVKGELWHPGSSDLPYYYDTCSSSTEAELFAVWDADAKDESDFIGYCYLDLFPRGNYIYQFKTTAC